MRTMSVCVCVSVCVCPWQVLKALYRAQNLDVRAQYLHLSSQVCESYDTCLTVCVRTRVCVSVLEYALLST